MHLYAFQGIHYDFAGDDGVDAGELAAPPYDQIDDELRDRLQATSPHHFTHLSTPVPGDSSDAYENAARLHERWLAGGVIRRDPEPAIYPYVIVFPDGQRRLGICAMIGLEPPESPAIRPHEQTLAKPLADRLALLERMHVDLEPILLVSDDGGALDRLLTEDVASAPELVVHRDRDGNRHILYRIDDPARIELYREALEGGPGAVADGHHRYKVAQQFAAKVGAEPGTAPRAKLAVVTSIASPALLIGPIHRALRERPDLARLEGSIAARATWDGGPEASGSDFADAVAAAPQPALGVWAAGGAPEIWTLDPGRGPRTVSAGARQLSVVLLHEVVLRDLGLSPEQWTDGTVLYRSDPDELQRLVTSERVGVGFWLPPMEPAAFSAALEGGDLLPPKSTRFLPKVISGLVWAGHGSHLR